MAQLSSLPPRTSPTGTDIIYLVDPITGEDYKLPLGGLFSAASSVGVIRGTADPIVGLGESPVGGPPVLAPITGYEVGGEHNITVDPVGGTIIAPVDGVYSVSVSITTDFYQADCQLALYLQDTVRGDVFLTATYVRNKGVALYGANITFLAELDAGEQMNIALAVYDNTQNTINILSVSFSITYVSENIGLGVP